MCVLCIDNYNMLLVAVLSLLFRLWFLHFINNNCTRIVFDLLIFEFLMYYIIIIQLNSHGLLGKLIYFSFIKCVVLFCVFRIGVVWVWFYTCFTCVCGENTPLSQRYRHLIRECPMRWVCNSIGRCKKFIAEDVWVSARLLRCVGECVCLSMRSGIVLLSSLKKFRFDYFSYVLVFLIFHDLLSSIFLVWVRQLIIFTFFL